MDTAAQDHAHHRSPDPPVQPETDAANGLVPTDPPSETSKSREKSRCWIESARGIFAHLILTRLVQAAADGGERGFCEEFGGGTWEREDTGEMGGGESSRGWEGTGRSSSSRPKWASDLVVGTMGLAMLCFCGCLFQGKKSFYLSQCAVAQPLALSAAVLPRSLASGACCSGRVPQIKRFLLGDGWVQGVHP